MVVASTQHVCNASLIQHISRVKGAVVLGRHALSRKVASCLEDDTHEW